MEVSFELPSNLLGFLDSILATADGKLFLENSPSNVEPERPDHDEAAEQQTDHFVQQRSGGTDCKPHYVELVEQLQSHDNEPEGADPDHSVPVEVDEVEVERHLLAKVVDHRPLRKLVLVEHNGVLEALLNRIAVVKLDKVPHIVHVEVAEPWEETGTQRCLGR